MPDMIAYQRWTLLAMLLAASLMAGCAGILHLPAELTKVEVPTTPPGKIIVAAAADLQFAFSELITQYESRTGQLVEPVFGSTGQLVQQIENGAPFDLIASANTAYVDRLASQNLVLPESVTLYAQGRITLAVNRESGIQATTLSDLLSVNIHHIAIANPEHAPYGLAAKQALQANGVWEKVQGKIVLAENIRQALQYVQSGDAQVGIIALSVVDVPEVTWTLLDSSLHEPLDQALAVTSTSAHPQLATQFSDYIIGQEGRAILKKYGFVVPDIGNLDPPTANP
jgi:molybdate transport system substrate-binding protein